MLTETDSASSSPAKTTTSTVLEETNTKLSKWLGSQLGSQKYDFQNTKMWAKIVSWMEDAVQEVQFK
ncbi:hypothetical protein Pyn_23182 [Prunus yedoensis var. nudiflora]|uniref:Uncharacterized protein n=1 Tax=Prunus yedoensis var. nudiflora TaxID=2094558 RepID=A0A314YSE9_PRUYE|nr:hypothetical protein Pyn_33011 [Prunus yedoensis var. nudiflora]PQQ07954.1 hypothetical protein Pyn_23182 [Prunus yedoensis var. nudiflora]